MIKKKILACCLAAIGLLTLFACSAPAASKELDPDAEKEIISAFIERYPEYSLTEEDVSLRCYAAFENKYVFFADSIFPFSTSIERDVIGGVKFIYPSGQKLEVYSGGEFYSLEQAYKEKVLSRKELRAVQKNYKKDHPSSYK